MPEFYRQVSHIDGKSGRLLSRAKWERKHPDRLHVIELFFYDKEGRILRDYSAAFLPRHHNAPYQTLINLHSYNGKLVAMRQFDASGARIFEHCRGTWFDIPVTIVIDEPLFATPDEVLESEEYIACFGFIPARLGKYLYPKARKPSSMVAGGQFDTAGDDEMKISILSLKLRLSPKRAKLYLERGNAYLQVLDFNSAIADFTKALKLDDSLDMAYFGRGMARGRIRLIDEAIADLTVFIARNPGSSLAHTKRGVRYIWKGDFRRAEADLKYALELDPKNAEANDDLGVLYARRRDYLTALSYFEKTIQLETNYQKAHHNKALVLHLLGRTKEALNAINVALTVGPDTRSSVVLKAAILEDLGRKEEAAQLRKQAETAPQKDWSENLAIE